METKFKPFDKVLVRTSSNRVWGADFYERYDEERKCHRTMGYATGDVIPYEGNEHLLGTTNDYVEPFEPKDGDFVTIEDYARKTWLVVWFKEDSASNVFFHFDYSIEDDCFYIDDNNDNKWGEIVDIEKYRPSTEEEKQILLDKLHKQGKDWDAEKKEIVDYKWMPKDGERYYTPLLSVEGVFPANLTFSNDNISNGLYKKGWVFKTKEECQALCDKLNEAIKNVK